jgi:hypothetical protein
LNVLINHLPAESATKTAMRDALTDEELVSLPSGHGHGKWSHTDMLLANLIDSVERLIFMNTDGKGPLPEPYPRPGVLPAEAAENALIDKERAVAAKAYMDAVLANNGASPDFGPARKEAP